MGEGKWGNEDRVKKWLEGRVGGGGGVGEL